MKIMGHNIPFYACSWFKDQEPRHIGAHILGALNAAERRQRLQWLWEGSLLYHMERKGDGRCPVEKALFARLVEFLESRLAARSDSAK